MYPPFFFMIVLYALNAHLSSLLYAFNTHCYILLGFHTQVLYYLHFVVQIFSSSYAHFFCSVGIASLIILFLNCCLLVSHAFYRSFRSATLIIVPAVGTFILSIHYMPFLLVILKFYITTAILY